MTALPVLIAGFVGAGSQDHQSDMWVPSLAAAGLVAAGVWTPPTVGDEALARARALAERLGLPLQVSPSPATDSAQTDAVGAIACLRGAERVAFLSWAAERRMPVLLDKPTLDDTAEIEAVVAAAGSAVVVPGHHFGAHPGFIRALAAVPSAEIGLLRAVAADLVVGPADGVSPVGELRNLGVYLVDLIRRATGPATVRLQAHAVPGGGTWTFLGQTERDVVVSANVSRTTSAGGGSGTLLAQIRLVGSHGSVLVDLNRPTLDVRTPAGHRTVPFGEDSLVGLLRRFASTIRGTHRPAPISDLVTLSRALDGIAHSAATGEPTTLTW